MVESQESTTSPSRLGLAFNPIADAEAKAPAGSPYLAVAMVRLAIDVSFQ
jgi:hypothetical protein